MDINNIWNSPHNYSIFCNMKSLSDNRADEAVGLNPTEYALYYIRERERELFLLIEKEAAGIAKDYEKVRSRSIETVVVHFNALNQTI